MTTVGPQRVPASAVEIALQVRRLLRRRPVTASQIAATAHLIFGWQFDKRMEAQFQVQQALDLAGTIHSAVREVAGNRSADLIGNTLSLALMRLYGVHMSLDEQCLLALQRYEAATYQLPGQEWLHMKVSVLFRAYTKRMYAVRLLREQMPTDEQAAAQLAALGLSDPEQTIRELAEALARHRAYGVKPSVFQDGILHRDEDAWVFADGHDLTAMTMPDLDSIEWARPLAITTLAARDEIKRLDPVLTKRGDTIHTAFDFRDKLMAVIHASGEFTVDTEIGAVPLGEYFAQAGRTTAYALFRIVHLLRLYDLIVPQYVTQRVVVPSWPILPRSASDRRKHRQVLAEGGLRPLVLPRLRVLHDPEAIGQALVRELVEAQAETERRTRRSPVCHPVTGFVKPLPGRSASPQARQRAWDERRIVLADEGETYVRAHKRGKDPNPTIGHLARVR